MEDRPGRFDISLLIETALAVIAAILAIKLIGGSSAFGAGWLITPGILIFAAIIPIAVTKRQFPGFGFSISQIKDSLIVLGWTCAVLFPLMFCGLWVLKSFGLIPPLAPVLSQGRDWVYWLFYQFMYVALSEEVFFRGYLQSNILRLTAPAMSKLPPAASMDNHSNISSLFYSSSYHNPGPDNIGTYIPAGFGTWLVVYSDQIASGAYFISWAG